MSRFDFLATEKLEGFCRGTNPLKILNGNQALVGVMIESNLVAGNQKIPEDLSQLIYGCSVTDACVDWDTTETMIREAAQRLRTRK